MAKKNLSVHDNQKRTLLVQSMDLPTSEKNHIRNWAGHETAIIVRMQ